MPIFNLTDITFNKATGNKASGPLGQLEGSKYDFSLHKYPIDLGSTDKAHYILININEQSRTQFPGERSTFEPTVVQNFRMTGVSAQGVGLVNTPAAQELLGKIQNVATELSKFSISNDNQGSMLDTAGKALAGVANGVGDGLGAATERLRDPNFVRTIRRIKEKIALYMPDTLAFNYDQNYDEPGLGGPVSAVIAGGSSLLDSIQNNRGNPTEMSKSIVKNLSPFFLSLLAQGNAPGKILFAATSGGLTQNPMLEVLYQSPNFRSFQFDFMFYPRDEKEATQIGNIINSLRFHQAPEVFGATNGFFLIPPSEFDIKFMYNNQENPNIPKISTCVLKSIFTDYAPNGFSAYEVPGQIATPGGTGMPVAIRLTLQFRETEIMTKSSYKSSDSQMQMFQDTGAGTTTNSFGQTINNNFAQGT